MLAANAPPASDALPDAGSLSGQAVGGDGTGALPRPDGLNLDARGFGCPTPPALIQLIGRAADAEALAGQAREPGSRPRLKSNAARVRGGGVERLARRGIAVPAAVQERPREMDR